VHRPARLTIAVGLALLAAGCGREELFHRLEEGQANEVLVALDEGGIAASKVREDGAEGGFTVSVPAADAARAERLLAERDLPRARAPGFAEVYAQGSMVPTPAEEHARYQHALAGELARSVEAIDGVAGARVHLGLPVADPLRPGERAAPRAAVLVRCRPASCAQVRSLQGGIGALVAGAVDGLSPAAVSVVITEAAESATRPPPPAPRRSRLLLGLAGLAALAGAAVAASTLWPRVRGAWDRGR
jgi:type III secretion protein J